MSNISAPYRATGVAPAQAQKPMRLTPAAAHTTSHQAATVVRRAAFAGTPEVLAELCRDSVNLAVWQRRLSQDLIAECQRFMQKPGFNNHRLVVPAAKSGNLAEPLPSLEDFPLLRADIELLADMFTCLFDISAIGLRLTPLTDTMCPKFHVDRVPCRLITTYVGPGTEWLANDCLDRSKLGAASAGLSDAESGLYPAAQSPQSLAPGAVALLKGELWEGNEGGGLVHRSPAVPAGQQRLILTFDFASSDL